MTFIVYLKDLSYFGVAGGNYLLSLFFYLDRVISKCKVHVKK